MYRIGLNALGDNANWAGGVYYIRNIAFQLSNNDKINNNYNIIIFTYSKNADAFKELPDDIKIIEIPTDRIGKMEMIMLFKRYKINYLYPNSRNLNMLGINSIAWIPDFQHNVFLNMFNEEEREKRTFVYKKIADSHRPLVLSSCDSLKDFRQYYSKDKQNVYVVPFVSYIEPIIRKLTPKEEAHILEKYGLKGSYTCIMNQFWQHKNHKVVFEAMEKLYHDHPNMDFTIVLTGKMEDYRNPEYIESLKSILRKPMIAAHVKHLGFISRDEQITIMKNASFIIQPSLFEGWGTVVEDAKVLDKTILLSDIPVHREQMNEKCTLFDPYDSSVLADLIAEESRKEHHDDAEKGITDMYLRAKEYSKGFEQLLGEIEKGR